MQREVDQIESPSLAKALSRISTLRPSEFLWTSEELVEQRPRLGEAAEEVQGSLAQTI